MAKALFHNLYWKIAQKKYGKFLFVQFDILNQGAELLTPESYKTTAPFLISYLMSKRRSLLVTRCASIA